ncbi:MAG: ATP-binding protein [Oscillospiraceae bacterium]|nr:ATP-binding protein [Oscillospiraceae bacterium]
MNNPFRLVTDRVFSKNLDFRTKLSQILQIAILLTGIAFFIGTALIGNSRQLLLIVTLEIIFILGLFIFSLVKGRNKTVNMITIISISSVCLPTHFFLSRGIDGSVPYYFIAATIVTVMLLEGKTGLIIAFAELTVFTGLMIFTYFFPDKIQMAETSPLNNLIYKLSNMVGLSIVLAIATFLLFRSHNRQQQELEASREEALRLSEVKNIFLSNMSHEIRTPINVMLGMTEMVLRDSREEPISNYARKIQNAGKMLLVLVNNILDVSKIEAGKLELIENCYRTAVLIQELFEIGSESARKHGLIFEIQVDDKLPTELWGDMPRIKQILSNFLSNAVKYSTDGSIMMSFMCKESEDENQIILLASVKDTGIGIKKENLSILFDAFARLDLPDNRNIEGTGLGLAIAKELTERMNGQVFVESEYGAGSVFWVEIPQIITDGKPMGDWKLAADDVEDISEESFTAPDARILVVDDNLENLQTVKALLQRTLMRVDLAESGAQCLEAVRKTDYHIILMDHMMPDMDGIETYHRLKEEFPDFRTPVIALTANAISGTELKFLAEGFVAYLTKPVQAQKLEETLAATLALTSAPATPKTIYSKTWAAPKFIEESTRNLASCGVSLEEGLQNASGDWSLLARMAEIFVQNYPTSLGQVKNISEALPINFEKLRYLAHSLKSGAGYVGASELSFFAKLLERGCQDCDSQLVSLTTPLLYVQWERARNALSAFAAHVRAAEPKASMETERFRPEILAKHIKNRVRLQAIRELDLLIAQKGASDIIMDVKQAIQELDFDKAEQILADIGI